MKPRELVKSEHAMFANIQNVISFPINLRSFLNLVSDFCLLVTFLKIDK